MKSAPKPLVLLALLIFLGAGIQVIRQYYFSSKHIVSSEADQKITPDKDVPLSLKLKEQKPESKIIDSADHFKSYKTEDENFEEFDQSEKIWIAKVKDIVGEKYFLNYQEMKRLNDEEKMQAYKEYHDYLRRKYGDRFYYNISEDQSIREKQINQRYLQQLLKLVGPEIYKQYTEARDLFNETMRRQNKESIQVEF